MMNFLEGKVKIKKKKKKRKQKERRTYLPILHPFLNIHGNEISLPFILYIGTLFTHLKEFISTI